MHVPYRFLNVLHADGEHYPLALDELLVLGGVLEQPCTMEILNIGRPTILFMYRFGMASLVKIDVTLFLRAEGGLNVIIF